MNDLENLCDGLPRLILCQSFQPLHHRFHFLLANKLPNKFFFIYKSGNRFLTDDRLTKFSLLCLFGRQRECGEKLHENLDDHLIHGFCGWDLGIDLEAIEEMSNRLKQIGQGTVVIRDTLDSLIRLYVTKISTQRLNLSTYGK